MSLMAFSGFLFTLVVVVYGRNSSQSESDKSDLNRIERR